MRYILFFFLLGFSASANLQDSLNEHIHFSLQGPNSVGYLYIGGHESQITQGTYLYVKQALEHYKHELKPSFILLELDTPGGEVFAAQKISDALKEMDIIYGIPVVAYINNWAMSAGAMLAYSCRYIAVVKDGSMGAAQPVTSSGEATSEKVNSAIRADFASRASFFDRNPLIAQAMVDADMVLVVREGKIIELKSDSEIETQDKVITRKGKLLTLSSQEMLELEVADFRLLPQKLQPITNAEKEAGSWPASQELLFTDPFFHQIPQAVMMAYHPDWKTEFLSFLSHPMVASLLFLGLMVGFYIEVSTPGFGAPGIVALICLSLIVLSSFAIQAAGWLELIILAAGVVLILIELFLIPGFGVLGILGIILAGVGLLTFLLPGLSQVSFDVDTHTLNAAGVAIFHRLVWLAGAVIVGVFIIAFLARYIAPRLALFSPLIHRGAQEGYTAAGTPNLPEIGSEGRAVSPLRPAGKVEIKGEIYDAMSSGSFIEKGKGIKIVAVEGMKMIVEEI